MFHDSPCKFFLVASREERARRRVSELQQRGIEIDFESVLAQQDKRDAEDFSRPVGGLRKAADAVEVCTTGLSLSDVVAHLLELVTEKLSNAAEDWELTRREQQNASGHGGIRD